MAGVSLEEFEQMIISSCSNLVFVESINILASTETSHLWRITLIDKSIVDVYYSESTGKTSFAQIKLEQRIFGADNAGDWHWHPRENPSLHVRTHEEITFEEFMKKLETSFK